MSDQLSIAKKTKIKYPAFLYTTKFSTCQTMVLAGGAGKREFKGFDYRTGAIVFTVSNLPKSIMSADVAKKSTAFCFGCADSTARMFTTEASV